MSLLFSWIWTERYWLPAGVKWEDLQPKEGFNPPIPSDFYLYTSILCVFLIVLRILLNPFVFKPLAMVVGIKDKKILLPFASQELEKLFVATKGRIKADKIQKTALSLNFSTRQVERWLRKRTEQNKLPKMQKFQDNCFVLLYHTLFTIYGAYVLSSKAWLWDFSLVCKGFPYHNIDREIWWYYIFASGFYSSMLIWEFFLPRMTSKDVSISYVHHFVTLFLLVGSWNTNFVRGGSLVLLIFECGDIALLLGRLLRFAKMHRAVDGVFAAFVVIWHLTRTGLYPFWIMRGIFMGTCDQYFAIPSFTAFHLLLYLLMILNLIWTGFIDYAVYKRIKLGYMKDVLTDDESDDELDEKEK